MLILGLNMFHPDASAAVVQDGEVVFAIAEERLNRVKHYGGVPLLSIKACLDAVGARISDVDHVYDVNPTPAWGHTGQVSGCQNNLEVGDPLTGTTISPIVGGNGFTYHLQELAFYSWFYGAPSVGIHGWFSDNATFMTDAGPPCT